MQKCLIVGVLSFFTGAVAMAAPCGQETRKPVTELKCQDLETETEYTLVINKMCGTLSGKQQPMLEIEEHRPNFKQQQWKLFKSQKASFAFKNAKKPTKVFKQRAGKKGELSATPVFSADGKELERIQLLIHPNGGEDCTQEWTLPKDFWEEKY